MIHTQEHDYTSVNTQKVYNIAQYRHIKQHFLRCFIYSSALMLLAGWKEGIWPLTRSSAIAEGPRDALVSIEKLAIDE